MPREPEVHALLALMLHCEARRGARRGSKGEYIPLSEQDPRHWSLSLIEEAERHLVQAASYERPGRFQLEAAIQSVHSERVRGCQIAWEAIARFYDQLVGILPTVGVRTGYAAAIAETSGPEKALSVLDNIEPDLVSSYQPYWAVRAHLLQRLKKRSEAYQAFNRAIGLSQDPAVREFLLRRRG
jgi:RNA polymerase sigma-70 factor (ECF subfamily)